MDTKQAKFDRADATESDQQHPHTSRMVSLVPREQARTSSSASIVLALLYCQEAEISVCENTPGWFSESTERWRKQVTKEDVFSSLESSSSWLWWSVRPWRVMLGFHYSSGVDLPGRKAAWKTEDLSALCFYFTPKNSFVWFCFFFFHSLVALRLQKQSRCKRVKRPTPLLIPHILLKSSEILEFFFVFFVFKHNSVIFKTFSLREN